MTITQAQQKKIADYLATHRISWGAVCTDRLPCSICAVNLALSGKFTHEIPDCMSLVMGNWIIPTQDGMNNKLCNSPEWKRLLPLAAGTGRDRELERLEIVMDWMWEKVLPTLQPIADDGGFGMAWREMLKALTKSAVADAAKDIKLWAESAKYGVDEAKYAAEAAKYAAAAVEYAKYAVAAEFAARSARSAVYAAAARSMQFEVAWSRTSARSAVWLSFDPVGTLAQLIAVEGDYVA